MAKKKAKKRMGRPPLLPHVPLKFKEILAGMLEVKPPKKVRQNAKGSSSRRGS